MRMDLTALWLKGNFIPKAILVLGIGLVFSPVLRAAGGESEDRLVAVWAESGHNQQLGSWTPADLSKFRKRVSREKDPETGKLVRWEGVQLATFLDKVLNSLTVEQRAQIDLVILKGASGEHAVIPRALVSKYPLMLALPGSEAMESQQKGTIYSIVPWTSHPKILSEDLPLKSYFVPRLFRIELTSYRDRYSPFFLKRRTDPSAMRGEKLFVQNCVTCHSSSKTPLAFMIEESTLQKLSSAGHPGGEKGSDKGSSRLSPKDWQSIGRYLNAYKQENPSNSKGFVTVR